MNATVKPNVVVCDLDGTLADHTHRLHHIQAPTKDWDLFYRAVGEDALIKRTHRIITALHRDGAVIVYLTGRSDVCRDDTLSWLERHQAPPGELWMRPWGNFRPDHEVKPYLLEQGALYGPEDVLVILEDRNRMTETWRERGYLVHQVAEGDY